MLGTVRNVKRRLSSGVKFVALEMAIAGFMAGPSMAQMITNGTGGDAPFAAGITTGLSWVHFAAAAVAVFGFIVGCIFAASRNVMGAITSWAFCLIGGALLANANDILSTLTGLTFS